MSRIKKELHNISKTSLGPVTEKLYSKEAVCLNKQSKPKPIVSSLDLKTEQIKKEIDDVKNQYLSMSFDKNDSGFHANLNDDVQYENEVSYYIFKRKKSIFHRLNKPNKGREFILTKIEKKKELTELINSRIFNHSNDLEYIRFMKEMSEWKNKKITEWKNIILF